MAITLLLLGATGNTGRPLARLLLEHGDARLLLASRDLDRARALAAEFERDFPSRVEPRQADAADLNSLRAALDGADWLAAASSTSAHAAVTTRACLDAGVDYFDVQYSSAKLKTLESLRPGIESAGRCFVTEGGFHPGLPAALVRWAADRLERMTRAVVGSVIQIDWRGLQLDQATVLEMVDEFASFSGLAFVDGRWKPMSWAGTGDYLRMDFPAPFGRQLCAPMFLEELRTLPEQIPSLRETGFYVGGFNWFVDWVLMPAMYMAMRAAPRLSRKPSGGLLLWGLKAFSRPPYGTYLKLEADGERAGAPAHLELTVSHPDGYFLTAAPAAACLLQLLDGSARRPGLHCQAQISEPVRLLRDMQSMGIQISEAWTK